MVVIISAGHGGRNAQKGFFRKQQNMAGAPEVPPAINCAKYKGCAAAFQTRMPPVWPHIGGKKPLNKRQMAANCVNSSIGGHFYIGAGLQTE